MDATATGWAGFRIGPLHVSSARQTYDPPHDVSWNPMLGIPFVFKHEIGGARFIVGVHHRDDLET